MSAKKLFLPETILSLCLLWNGQEVSAQNNRLWATYYGGLDSDAAYSIATDASGNVYMAGTTASLSGIASGGFQNTLGGGKDSYLVKFDANGKRLWGTYYGGTGDEGGTGQDISVATDNLGNVYLAGYTKSNTGIAAGGSQNMYGGGTYDAFLVKFDASGKRLWATYYGGTGDEGSGLNSGISLASDNNGNVYLAGNTNSANLISGPAIIGAGQTAVGQFWAGTVVNDVGTSGAPVAWANPSNAEGNTPATYAVTGTLGSNVYSNFLKATDFNISIPAGSIVTAIEAQVDWKAGNNFPRSAQVYLVKNGIIQSNGANRATALAIGTTQTTSTFGNTNFGDTWNVPLSEADVEDSGFGVAIAVRGGPAIPAGQTVSIDRISIIVHYAMPFPPSVGQPFFGGNIDAFLVKYDAATGNKLWDTYYGGTGDDFGRSVAADAAGNVYLAGATNSVINNNIYGMASSGGFQNVPSGADAFLVKFDVNGNRFWGTYYGNGASGGSAVATDVSDNVYLAGSTGNPIGISTGGFQNTFGGQSDAFLVKFDTDGNRKWATYYGGIFLDGGSLEGPVMTTDISGNVCLAGDTYSPGSSLASGGFQNSLIGSENVFVVKFDSTGNRLCATYYGIGPITNDEDGRVAVDRMGNVYLSGTSGNSGLAIDGYQNMVAGFSDAFLVKFGLSASTTSTDVLCFGEFTGTATVNTLGTCTPSYSYLWNPGGQITQTAVGLCAGTYTVLITDASGAMVRATATINQPAATITLSITATTSTCGHSDGSAFIIAAGGTGPFTYSWNNTQSTPTISYLTSALYSVTVTDANGCVKTDNIQVGNNPGVTAQIISSLSVTCFNLCNGELTIGGTGGSPAYTYQWTNGSTAATITGLCAGPYTATVTDGNGCTSSTSFNITQPDLLTASILEKTDLLCYEINNGRAAVNPTGGTNPYTYQWSNGGNQFAVSNLQVGSYTVTVTDATGCVTTATTSISQPSEIAVDFNVSDVLCYGENKGIITTTVSEGIIPYSYQWNNGSIEFQISNLQAGGYTVTITDNNGCKKTATTIINEPALLTVLINPISGCGVPNPSASAIANGGTGSYTYLWNNLQNTPTVSDLPPAIYSVTVTDANNCTATNSVNVIPGSTITATTSGNVTIVFGKSIVLSAFGGGNYQWAPSSGLNCDTCANPIANPQSTTEYCVIVTDGNDCSESACLTIKVDTICEELFIPNAFSPNEDNNNNMFCIYGTNCTKSLILKIYNRWGEKVFETNDPKECWYGMSTPPIRSTREEENDAVFIYYLEVTLKNNQTISKRGNITLIK